MKSMNFCAIAVAALAVQFSGLQNLAFAQSGTSSYQGNVGEDIALIYNGNSADFENSPRSLLPIQTAPANNGNHRWLSRKPYSESQRAAFYEGMRYQESLRRDNARQANRPQQYSYSRNPGRNRYNQAAYADDVPLLESPVQRDNFSDLDEQYEAYRQGFAEPDSNVAQSQSHPRRGGCRGRCRSQERGDDYDGARRDRSYPQRDEFQYDQRRPNQFPNSEADKTPSLRAPVPRSDQNQLNGYRNDAWQPDVNLTGDRTAFSSPGPTN